MAQACPRSSSVSTACDVSPREHTGAKTPFGARDAIAGYMQLTLAAAIFAGLVAFLSPCVLPVVPAYLGQIGVVTASSPGNRSALEVRPRWRVIGHALAFVLGFGAVFVLLGLTVYAFRPLFELAPVRVIGGLLVMALGLNLMGLLRLPTLARGWSPFRFGSAPFGGSASGNPLASLALGAVFAGAHTPCIGPTLGAVLGLSLTVGPAPDVVLLLVAYSFGVGIPFVALALAVDRTRPLVSWLRRHGRAVELVGGAFVVVIGLAVVFNWLAVFSTMFYALWPRV